MFTGTLKFNLDPEDEVSDDRIIALLKKAKLDTLLNKNPKGLHQEIEENGSNLSSGER
jgi:ABC-type multidrug transport system fused ATPase/permease subunit